MANVINPGTNPNQEGTALVIVEDGPAGMAITDAARRSLKLFFDKLVGYEEEVFASENITSIHQMRVTTRKLRASLQALEGVFSHKLIQRYRRGLRRIAESLGEVRDGDVFLEDISVYSASLPEERRVALASLTDAVTSKRERARRRLLKVLKGKKYNKLKKSFVAFLETPRNTPGNMPGKGELPSPAPYITQRVRDFAGSTIWRRYELWRAYETVLAGAADETLHQARIAGKRLRYTIEFFSDSLGPDVKQLLDPLSALQDCLGSLQDVVTAKARIAEVGLSDDAGALEYLAARNVGLLELKAKLPALWEQVASAAYQRRLFELIVRM